MLTISKDLNLPFQSVHSLRSPHSGRNKINSFAVGLIWFLSESSLLGNSRKSKLCGFLSKELQNISDHKQWFCFPSKLPTRWLMQQELLARILEINDLLGARTPTKRCAICDEEIEVAPDNGNPTVCSRCQLNSRGQLRSTFASSDAIADLPDIIEHKQDTQENGLGE